MNLTPARLLVLALLSLALPASAQQAFPKPEDAAQALVDALGTTQADTAKLATLFGKDWRHYIPADSVERADVDAFLARWREGHKIQSTGSDSAALQVGTDPWILPVPLTKRANGWAFDLKAGEAEIRKRRIGRNELSAIESVRAYHDAQTEYAEADHDGDGVLEYAQKILSSNGLHDGLFWSDDDSGDISPLGPLFGDATPGADWHGYHFRILTAQGPSAPGGAYNYVLGKDMSRGFALIAWPAQYGESGLTSFMISHDGQIFEKDLGPAGERTAKAMKSFDPDDSWKLLTDDAAAKP